MWMVRAGSDGYLFEEYHRKNVISIGYGILKDISEYNEIDGIKDITIEFYPHYSLIQISIMAGQLYRFKNVMDTGDYIITYDPNLRNYLIGEIIGNYNYNESLIPDYPHSRKMKWLKLIPRDMLSTTTKNSLGVIMTMYEVPKEIKDEILYLITNEEIKSIEYVDIDNEITDDSELSQIKNDITTNAFEFIKDKVLRLSHKELKDLTSGILKSMGYQVKLSPHHLNKEYDLEASRDGFGFDDRKTFVKIQAGDKPLEIDNIKSLKKYINNNNNGIITIFGRISDQILKDADKNNIRLIDLDQLVNLLIQHYEGLDHQTKFIIPLTKIYWPL